MPFPPAPLVSWLDTLDRRWPGARRRGVSFGLALLIEVLILLALLTLGSRTGKSDAGGEAITTFDVREDRPAERPDPAPEAAPPPSAAAAAQPPSPLTPRPVATPSPPAVILPRPTTTPAPAQPPAPPAPAPSAAAATPKITAVIRSDMASFKGPQGAAGASGDSERVAGSGPNGEPLYRAQWYREPYREELAGYLSRVDPPAWALINCQTMPGFKVDNCVLVDEWPERSNTGRAVLAAAWQFLVRPPRVGGKVMVGQWVRIRIDYTVKRG